MVPFELLTNAASVSKRVDEALEYIQGGPLTAILHAIGDLHYTSAIEHLEQAQRSPSPRSRLLQAAGDLQTAFFAYDKAAWAGPSRHLRIRFDAANVNQLHDKASGCSATIALIQWVTDEAVPNRRRWLDRAARHVGAYCKNQRDIKMRGFLGVGLWRHIWDDPNDYYRQLRAESDILKSYFRLEQNTLPASDVRPKPASWRVIRETRYAYSSPDPSHRELYSDEHWLPSFELD
jgi:hypothetical protein